MKPKIFIASSREARDFATAIHCELQDYAECTPWTSGAFELSESIIQGLIRNLHESDFGVFILAPDDLTNVRGSSLNTARDNVIFEAGLFSGHLGPGRCFMVIPQSADLHMPTDLLGLTLGRYEDARSDGNTRAAVAPVCHDIRGRIESAGLFSATPQERLHSQCVKYDCCCEWITDTTERVRRKREIFLDIEAFCNQHPVVKSRLLRNNSPGYYLALLVAIRLKPESRDAEIILQMEQRNLPTGFSQEKLLDAVDRLRESRRCSGQQLQEMKEWLLKLPEKDQTTTDRVNAIA